MRKTIWLLTALCLSGTTLTAAPITKQRAQQIAAKPQAPGIYITGGRRVVVK